MKIGRNIDLIPRYIAGIFQSGDNVSEEDQSLFLDYVKLSTVLVSRTFAAFELCEHNGYLLHKNGAYAYYVPYNLVPTFPSQKQVVWLEPVISASRLTTESRFCFSGSSTFLGQLTAIGDLDFCEYVPENVKISEAVELKRHSAQLQLVKVKCGDLKVVTPVNGEVIDWASINVEPSKPFKVDYILRDQFYGALPVTNVIIITDGKKTDSNLLRSFAYQEVTVGPLSTETSFRDLDVFEFGRYASWLQDEVDMYIKKADQSEELRHLALKALKRALSWFLIVGLEEEVESIIDKLKAERLEELAAIYRLAEVMRLTGQMAADKPTEDKDRLIEKNSYLNDLLKLAKSLQQTILEYVAVEPLEKTA